MLARDVIYCVHASRAVIIILLVSVLASITVVRNT